MAAKGHRALHFLNDADVLFLKIMDSTRLTLAVFKQLRHR